MKYISFYRRTVKQSIISFSLQNALLLNAFQTKQVNAIPRRRFVYLPLSPLFANTVPVYSDGSINNAKIKVDDFEKAPCTSSFPQNIDPSGPSVYEISKCFHIINFWLSVIYPPQVQLIPYLILSYLLNQEGCDAQCVVATYRSFGGAFYLLPQSLNSQIL